MNESRWAALRRRLQEAGEKYRDGLEITPEEKAALLAFRARELAKPDLKDQKEDPVEVTVFRLANERYALESQYIREVYPLKSLTPIPGTPAFISGIINLRGQIISVVDLKQFFQLPAQGFNDFLRVIVLAGENMEFGILAEEVMGAITIYSGDLRSELPTLTGIRADFLKGVAPDRLIVLDAVKLLKDKRMEVNQVLESGS